MNIRAIAFDLDDTMLRDDRTLSAFTVTVLRKAAELGVKIIPASGRARNSIRPFVDQIGCAACYIACNGAEIWNPAHESLQRLLFPDVVAQRIIAFARENGSYAQTYAGDQFYYMVENDYAVAYASASLLKGEFTPDMEGFIAAHPTCKILVMDDERKIARMLTEAKVRFAGEAAVTCSKSYFLEFNPPEATKGNALVACGKLLGFDLSEALAFGDSLNDLSMLETAGLGVAVANAREDVRARVRAVCGSNEEDGPAHFICEQLDIMETLL
ncbi:MAG: HAD family phosphatase [Clostridia bacterium]|nr:HAD family phosphatase [Clostridia bacterium]